MDKDKEQLKDKLISGFIPAELYWKFRATAVARQEKVREALANAIYMYLDAGGTEDDTK